MKKLYFSLLLIVVSVFFAVAGDKVKVLRIYNGGVGSTIPLMNIDSLTHPTNNKDGSPLAESVNTVIESVDTLYNIPVASIDSMVVADVDAEEFLSNIKSVQTYIAAQGEQEVVQFQKNLIDWLDTQEWVSQTFINSTKDFIIITFTNGLELYISFQDATFFDDSLGNEARMSISRAFDKDEQYIDVSYQEGEEPIKMKDILYIQGRNMLFSNASLELYEINDALSLSPIQLKLSVESCNLEVLTKDWSNFGLVLVSQTHGVKNGDFLDGSFSIEDPQHPYYITQPYTSSSYSSPRQIYFSPMLELYIKDKAIENYDNSPILYCIKPKLIAQKLYPQAIYYGRYCWSYQIHNTLNCTVLGYEEETNYYDNLNALCKFTQAMFAGLTVQDATNAVEKFPPSLNNGSKQRYFSIKTDDVTREKNGHPLITGKINGWDNLKQNELTFVIYSHEGSDAFSPNGSGVKRFVVEDKVKSDGTFEFEYKKDINTSVPHGFIAAFEYKDRVYYGNMGVRKGDQAMNIITDKITGEFKDGCLIITGQILDYGSLDKDQLKFYVYSHLGTDYFTPYDEVAESEPNDITIAPDGKFTIAHNAMYMIPDNQYGIEIGYKYQGHIYYSDPQNYEKRLCPDDNHPHFIDLGLEVKWSCCNLGASRPEDIGNFYAWGETEPKTEFTEENYKHKGSYLGSDISGTEYDAAATANAGCMPNNEDCDNLLYFLRSASGHRTTDVLYHYVPGILYTSYHTGECIFFPLLEDNKYWASTNMFYYPNFFNPYSNHEKTAFNYDYQYVGHPIRPILR